MSGAWPRRCSPTCLAGSFSLPAGFATGGSALTGGGFGGFGDFGDQSPILSVDLRSLIPLLVAMAVAFAAGLLPLRRRSAMPEGEAAVDAYPLLRGRRA